MNANWKVMAAALATVGALGSGLGRAATKSFDNGDGNQQWTTGPNWNPDGTPGAGDIAIVDGGQTALFNGASTTGAIVVGAPANLTGAGSNPGGAGALDVQSGTLTADNDNILIGFNDGDGLVVVSGGTLAHTNGGIFAVGFAGDGRTGTLSVSASGSVNNSTDFYIGANGASGSATFAGTLNNAGSIIQGSGGAVADLTVLGSGVVNTSQHFVGNGNSVVANLTIQDTATINVTGQLTVGFNGGGAVSMTGGALNVNGAAGGPAGDNLWVGRVAGGTFAQSGGVVTINPTASYGLRLAEGAGSVGIYNLAGGTLVTPGISIGAGTGAFTLGGGTLEANNSFTSSVPIAVSTGANGIVNTAGNNVTLSGPITGATAAGFFKQGTGTLLLSGDNTFGGDKIVDGGTLSLGSATALGTTTNVYINLGTILDPNGQTVGAANATNLVLNGAGAQIFNFSPTGSTIGSAIVIQAADTAVGGTGDLVLNGVVSDSLRGFSFNKTSDNTLTVNNTLSIGGPVNVLGGALYLNGTRTGLGQLTVANGATFGGSGTVASSNIVAAGNVAPGAAAGSIGTLTAGANVDLNGLLLVDITGAGLGSTDLLAVGGVLDIGGASLNLNVLSGLDDAAYVIATYGSLTGGAFSSVNNLPVGYTIDYGYLGNSIALTATAAVPEPTAIAMIGIAAVGLLGRRRRAC
ncbi:MAG TPA: autotransporter-associated beta strand repeat-containing protein [Tepidisphaeraceae bacterium]|jgi:autotransporter-associated beta strand protein|nr:autotransporter-associated beta strand repeat-containing protein [Tepidisphaeraceae bacterium]